MRFNDVKLFCKDWFNMDYNYKNDILRSVIDREAAKCYKDWKSSLHRHYKRYGRESLLSNMRNQVHWDRCCDMFSGDKFQASTETQEPMSAIDSWADMHRRGDSWVNTHEEQTFMLSQKHYSGASPSSAGSFSDATSSAQPDPRMDRYLKKSYREQMKIYDNQVKMLELVSKLQPNIQLPTIARPKPVDLDAPLPLSDDDNPDDDSAVGDAANLDE
ncbi:hypothetical protein L484_027568 [Morus notabilis]|uniref:Uncharacterized protein n=1 Tax=Morus notabilis TaxID=981085 RepID=W9S900_9ROSA|nr:hypothetical protein L484_027568 [Morus notabilis]